MGRPRKKQEEETQVEAPEAVAAEPTTEDTGAEAVEEQPTPDSGEETVAAVAEEAPAEAPEAPADEVVEVEETGEEGETERTGAVVEPAAADEPAAEEPAAEEPAAEEPAAEAPPVEEAPAPPPAKAKRRSPLTRAEKKAKRAARPKPGPRPAGERKPIVRLPKPEHARGGRKERRGVVVSSAMDKTIVVRVETLKPDRRYKKVVRRSSKFHAHDERNEANVGDVVRIVETRPLSKTKNWRLAEVLEAAK